MNPTKSETIKRFLELKAHKDFAEAYHLGMECQVNVAQDGGERIDGEFKGRRWHGWSDGVSTWKSFRIPYKANTTPEYVDKPMTFDLAAHVEGIGMTGWCWTTRTSKWVAYDFDAIVGHSDKHLAKLTHEELESVKKAAVDIPWVTVRYSAGGKGLHLYVNVDDVPTANHNEHAALARSILGKMSAMTGFDFHSKVDICGGNMWVWHRKAGTGRGFQVVKKGDTLYDVPPNWRDHIKVVTGTRRKNLPQNIEKQDSDIDGITSQYNHVKLDDDHKKLIKYLGDVNALWWWDQDHHMLVTHTMYLQEAKEELKLKGIYQTDSRGTNRNEQNCFAIPQREGAWIVRRFTPGVQEHESWDQDGSGWTRCYLNVEPDLGAAARAYGGVEDPSGGHVFREAETAAQAALAVGVRIDLPIQVASRPTKLKQHKDGRLVAEIEYNQHDQMPGWLHKKTQWTKVFNAKLKNNTVEEQLGAIDNLVRHVVTETEDYGWMLHTDGAWRTEPLAHIRIALQSLGNSTKDISYILGNSVFQCWRLINKPFQPEYPGNRQWNRNAAQLRYMKSTDIDRLYYPSWKKILTHCGSGLDATIANNPWCQANGLKTGFDYLKCWIASLFQAPEEPLPYLFMYGPQNSGKSILHEAIQLLVTRGVQRADAALTSQTGFNGELDGAILCVVEETDLNKNKTAYNRIKDWVTGRDMLIHPKGMTPYHVNNTSHWIQCGNNHQDCPVFPGDTRITMCYVEPLSPLELVPKRQLLLELQKEAPDFLASVLGLEIPPSQDRLNVPVVTTEDKRALQSLNQNALGRFIEEQTVEAPGEWIKFSDLVARFQATLHESKLGDWTKVRISRELPAQYPKGRNSKDAQVYVGNISWVEMKGKEESSEKYIIGESGYLRLVPR